MSDERKNDGAIRTVPELLAHALAMETEAAERYGELADQMETHRKAAVAAIFRRLEKAEKKHLVELTEMCSKVELPHYRALGFQMERPAKVRRPSTSARCTTSCRCARPSCSPSNTRRKAAEFYAGIARPRPNAEVGKAGAPVCR